MAEARMTLPMLAGVIKRCVQRQSEFVIPAVGRGFIRALGSMDDDQMSCIRFAGVGDLPERP
jgi:hypothetical protein